MRKRIIITLAIALCSQSYIAAQWTIGDCQAKAKLNYPLIKRYGLIEKTKEYNLSNANKAYLPQFAINGKASYQSEVTKIPISIPGIKEMAKDQYSASIDIYQNIWDGGTTNAQKELIKAGTVAEQKQTDVELYAINERVNQLFFGILLLNAQIAQNGILQAELQRNYDLISGYMANGVANQSDLDAIKVEQLNAIQSQTQLKSNRLAYIQALGIMIGEELTEKSSFQEPNESQLLTSNNINRPELSLFSAQSMRLDTQKKLIKASYMPKFNFFLSGGYGRPGLDMLSPDFSPYYIGGIRLTWNFGSLYTRKNDIRKIETEQAHVDLQKETFLFNTKLRMTQENNEISKNRELVKDDDEIIRLRENVKKAAEAKVANGTMSVSDLTREINNEHMSRQNKALHEIQLLMSIYSLKNTTNN
jgi:outer membrane protein TolC